MAKQNLINISFDKENITSPIKVKTCEDINYLDDLVQLIPLLQFGLRMNPLHSYSDEELKRLHLIGMLIASVTKADFATVADDALMYADIAIAAEARKLAIWEGQLQVIVKNKEEQEKYLTELVEQMDEQFDKQIIERIQELSAQRKQ